VRDDLDPRIADLERVLLRPVGRAVVDDDDAVDERPPSVTPISASSSNAGTTTPTRLPSNTPRA
jgi:hypothetical protein